MKPLLSIPFYLKDVSYKKLSINVIRDILRYEQWINNVGIILAYANLGAAI